MNSLTRCLALLVLCASTTPAFVAQPVQVLTQDLPRLRVAGKVSAVMWTRRDDAFTLQVVLEMPTEFKIASKTMAVDRAAGRQVVLPSPPLPRVQAWVLRADGTSIPRAPGSPAFPPVVLASDGIPLEMKYSFPVSAAQDAMVVVIMVDGAYYVEQLRPFGK